MQFYVLIPAKSQPSGALALKLLTHLFATILLLQVVSATAAEKPESCVIPPSVQAHKSTTPETARARDASDTIEISADSAYVIESETTTFEGNVVVQHRGRTIRADRASYHQPSARLRLEGNVQIESADGDIYETRIARVDANRNTGSLGQGQFYFSANNSRGGARKMTLNEDKSVTFESVQFSTCPANNETWSLYFRRLTLDRESDNGIGHHAVLRIKDIPVFYTPYLRFPLGNRRQSGLLVPEFGTSDKVGTFVALPYYLNLAPNYDATVTPRWMSRRGLIGESEFRYLGNSFTGHVEIDYLSQDAITGTRRSYVALNHRHQLARDLSAFIDYAEVSDQNYFADLVPGQLASSPTHLQQRVQVTYQPTGWAVSGQITDYQVLDSTLTVNEIPYRRVPQLSLSMLPRRFDSGFSSSLNLQYGQFEHPVLESAKRINFVSAFQYPVHKSWGYITPALTGYYTSYMDRSIGGDTRLGTVAMSIDSGLVFERKHLGDSGWSQTLEPRAFYAYVPFQDQSTLPLFDTSEADFNFDSLFRVNRFTGGDRIGDKNQLTLALGSRLLDGNDNERLEAQIGQTLYFQNRQVSAALPASPAQTETQSETIIELAGMLGPTWFLRDTWSGNISTRTTSQSRQALQYQPDRDRIFSLGHRYAAGSGNSLDAAAQWKFGTNWSLFSHIQYDLGSQVSLNSLAGFRYRACCWSVQAITTRRVDNLGVPSRSFEFQFTLTGLGSNNASNKNLPLSQSVFFDR